jgi:cellulose synthase (UDP-forming)
MLPVFHLTAEVSKFFFAPFGRPFNVTVKGHRRDQPMVQWSIAWIFMTLGLILAAGMLMNLTGYSEVVRLNNVTSLDIGWTLYCLVVLFLCILACVEFPRVAAYDPSAETTHGHPVRAAKALFSRLFM